MKRFFVPLILILSFFILIPQSVFADVISYYRRYVSQEKQEEIENDLKKQYSACLQEHKSKLPKEYKGPNLKIITQSREITHGTSMSGPLRKSDIPFHTGNEYFILTDNQTDTNMISEKSLAFDCTTEHIKIYGISVNVTDVPVGSYLKYIPDSDELQVLPPDNELNAKHKLGSKNDLMDHIRHGLRKEYTKDFQCLSEKKDKVSEKYIGPNLKPETILDHANISRLQTNNHCMNKYLFLEYTGNKYNVNNHEVNGEVCGCDEYIKTHVDSSHEMYVYKVTDVPAGSTLKYIPETKEMQVFPLTKEDVETKFKEELKIKDKLMCLYKKKLNLPKEYKGSNLKLETDKKWEKQLSTGMSYFHVFQFDNPLYDGYSKSTYNSSGVYTEAFSSVIITNEEACKEYIFVRGNTRYHESKRYGNRHYVSNLYRGHNWYYDVTNVPPGSYLKYIPETKEFQVFPTEDKSYNKLIKDKMKDMKNKEMKLRGSIATGNIKLMLNDLEEFKKSFIKGIGIKKDQTKAEEIFQKEIEERKKQHESHRTALDNSRITKMTNE